MLDVFDRNPQYLADGRFVAHSIENGRQTTTHIFFVDVGTGAMAVLEYDRQAGSQAKMTRLSRNLYTALSDEKTDRYRSLTLIPHRDIDRRHEGLWIRDSQDGSIVYLDQPRTGNGSISRIRYQ